MLEAFDLTKLDPTSFEHLVNTLALRVLGSGHTGFGPGSDGGRDGYFEGEAPYPSSTERWRGKWYVQSKFHKPHLSTDAQKWLISQVKEELSYYSDSSSNRVWPDIWIVATNVNPSGTPGTGAFDRCRELVASANPQLAERFHIWGGEKIISFLNLNPDVAKSYAHFITPGQTISAIKDALSDAHANVDDILRHFVVKQFGEQQYTRLEQAGSTADTRPGIHKLFIDLPFISRQSSCKGMIMPFLSNTSAKSHRVKLIQANSLQWKEWGNRPEQARVWFVRGGPGQGKSTIGQYFSQIQRACIILEGGMNVIPNQIETALDIKNIAEAKEIWPSVPRIPITVELREYARWLGSQDPYKARGILTYLAMRIGQEAEQTVLSRTLKRALSERSWLIIFDGLDEVPQDVKDDVASEVCNFINDVAVEINADLLALCTSRPQGYSGQFSQLDGPTIDLTPLTVAQALECARPIIRLDRPEEEAEEAYKVLEAAMASSSIQELMTTPLQSHIMAVVVRDGGRPPERRWQLFSNFYQVIRRREANRNLPEQKIAELLREKERLLKTVHNQLGFVLHARAETSNGAQTNLSSEEFFSLARRVVEQLEDTDIENVAEVLQKAAKERLVLVSTPDDGNHVRFDIRPLQEFFAAEFLYENISVNELKKRLEIIAGDAHWREVMYFLLSALVENVRHTELTVAIEVLEQLNEEDENPFHRLLGRRLGRGAILAARLFQEGVLENDKSLRRQFRKCLEPLVSSTDQSLLKSLFNVKQPNSRAWLLSFLIDTLQEASPPESIGAAIILSHILPDKDERIPQIQRILFEAPINYISFVFDTWANDIDDNDPFADEPTPASVPDWFLCLTLKFLLSPRWSKLSTATFLNCIDLLSSFSSNVISLAVDIGLSTNQIELLRFLLGVELKSNASQQSVDVGLLKGYFFENDWTTYAPGYEHLKGDKLKVTAEENNFLQIAYKMLRFLETKLPEDLKNLLEVKLNDSESSLVLPDFLRAFIPNKHFLPAFFEHSDLLDALSQMENKPLHVGSKAGRVVFERPLRTMNLNIGEECKLEQWIWCLDNQLGICLALWDMDLIHFGTEASKPSATKIFHPTIRVPKTGEKLILDRLLMTPAILTEYAHIWGNLLAVSDEREQFLRDAIKKSCADSAFLTKAGPDNGQKYKPFLPSEACLLPRLAVVLLNSLGMDMFDMNDQEASRQADKQKAIDEFCIADSLEDIANDERQDLNNRAAAALIFIARSDTNISVLSTWQDLLLSAYERNKDTPYLTSLLNALSSKGTEKDPSVRMFVAKLLDLARQDYNGRRLIDNLLRQWREKSDAPVHNAGVENSWVMKN